MNDVNNWVSEALSPQSLFWILLWRRKGILFGFAFSCVALSVISGLGPRMDWWAWMIPVGFMIFLFLIWPKMGNAWFRNGEVGFRKIWIDE